MPAGVTIQAPGIEGRAILAYVPRSRGQAHADDSVSQALLRFHQEPRLDWADLYARLMQHALPIALDTITFPPPKEPTGWSAGRTLADALSRLSGIPCSELVFWDGNGGSWKDRGIVCPQDMQGRRVVIVDDIWNTGATMIRCADALKRAGATSASALCLGYVASRERSAEDIRRDQERGREALDTVGSGHKAPTKAEFIAAVGDIPAPAEAQAAPVSQQLWRASYALNAYAQWCMENLEGAASFSALAGTGPDPTGERLQGLADAVLEALRRGPFSRTAEKVEEVKIGEPRLRMIGE